MQSIVTKYHGATNTRPSKITAKSASGLRLSLNYDHQYTADQMHERAARALCDKHGWTNDLIGGGLSNSEEVWVMIPRGYKLVREDVIGALTLAEATLERIAPDGARATQGTRDVIRRALDHAHV